MSTSRAPSKLGAPRQARPLRRAMVAPKPIAQTAYKPLRLGANLYIVQTQPGLEGVAWSEIASHYSKGETIAADGSNFPTPGVRPRPRAKTGVIARPLRTREIDRRLVADRAAMTIFTAPRPDPLNRLRTAEDVFAIVGYRDGLAERADALDRIRAASRDARWLEDALATHARFVPGSRAGRRLRFRVVARMIGEHPFRRIDMGREVAQGISEREDHNWRLVEEEADVEFWATMFEGDFILALRLSGNAMRQREYKVAHLAGSLRPSVAASLAWLTEPTAEDTVLDPFCGTGTVLIERAHLGRYRMLLGSDNDPVALRAAGENIGPRYKPLELHPWDATAIPLAAASVDKVVTNLPWGMRHGSHTENRRLYPQVIKEFRRLVRPGGLIVMLTAETPLMGELMTRGIFRAERVIRITVLGAPAAIYVCRQ
jgi:tRNA (guanine6-N2)-methyltransferase